MAPLEPQEKVLVSKEFLETPHGSEVTCVYCHGGDQDAQDKDGAHKGLDPKPTVNNVEKACGECHGEIVSTSSKSLHTTLSTFPVVLMERSDPNKWEAIDEARSHHCASCHTNSCGACHVSRPQASAKGFINGHIFQKHSDPINQCTACHGSRVGMEYYGMRGEGDIHAKKSTFDCVACHSGTEMHADGTGLAGRYHLPEMVRCEDCHKDLQYGSVRDHGIHIGKVQCQVCHSQTYVNCNSCHTGRDEEGLYYFQNGKEYESMRIGRNYDKTAPGAKYDYMLVRHIPVDPDLFEFYVKDGLTNFSRVPNWKRTSPHNIQRKTWQAANCNNCHGNRKLFLDEADLFDYERKANRNVVVANEMVPKAIEKTAPFSISTAKVRTSMVVDANWLHNNGEDALIVDARPKAEYDKGHIEKAISFDPLASGIRTGLDDDLPFTLVEHEKISAALGSAGIDSAKHIVVYDKDGKVGGYLLWVLQYAGASKVSFLSGGIEGWHEAGFHLTETVAKPIPVQFIGKAQPKFVADNDFIRGNIDNPGTVILDVRIVSQVIGLSKHGAAERAGYIPGSVNVPLGSLYMENGFIKNPAELLWLLKKNGVTPSKTVVTSCNTGQFAGSAFFILRYLGFDDVRVHYESWVNWSLEE